MVPGSGRAALAAVLLFVGGVLDIFYAVAAIGNSSFFVRDAKFIFSTLHTWGWIMLGLGILEIIAAISVLGAGAFGRWFGIAIGGLNAIGALLAIPAYPLWGIAIFGLSLWIIHGLAIYGEIGSRAGAGPR